MPRVKKEPSESSDVENRFKRNFKIKSGSDTKKLSRSSLRGITANQRAEIVRAMSSGAKLLKQERKSHKDSKRSIKREYSDSDSSDDSEDSLSSVFSSSESSTASESESNSDSVSDSDSDSYTDSNTCAKFCVDKHELERALGIKIRKHKKACRHNMSDPESEVSSDESNVGLKKRYKRRHWK